MVTVKKSLKCGALVCFCSFFFSSIVHNSIETNMKQICVLYILMSVCLSLHFLILINETCCELNAHVSVFISSCWNNLSCRVPLY